jgi:hypothetical protein
MSNHGGKGKSKKVKVKKLRETNWKREKNKAIKRLELLQSN